LFFFVFLFKPAHLVYAFL
jgi:hypothetical protein